MQYLLTSAALVATTLAAPANLANRQNAGQFEIKQVKAGTYYKNGPMAMLSTYEKFARAGAVAPEDVKKAAAAAQGGQEGSVQANPEQYDSAYLCPVNVGGQQLTLDFDTGSADLWVFSTETPRSENGQHTDYNTASGTLDQGATWSITYGDGSGASGNVYYDKVVVGGVTATSQAVEAATSVSSSFTQNADSDGLLGLAFSSINTVQPQPVTTFFDTVSPTLNQDVFTVDLKNSEPGSYTFGYIDSSKYTGSITYVSVDNSQGFWGFTAGGYAVGGGNGSSTVGNVGSAIADTGTSLLYLPSSVVTAYYNQVQGASYNNQQAGYVYPCSTDLPDFSVSIGGTVFTVPGSYINFAPISQSGQTCFGGIQPNTGIGFSIFGDVFLKSVYAVFSPNGGSPQLGFAAQS